MDRGIQKALVRLKEAKGKLYSLTYFCWVDCPPGLCPPAKFVAYRSTPRKAFDTSVERSGDWPYWWVYLADKVYRLDDSTIEVVQEIGAITEIDVINEHHTH